MHLTNRFYFFLKNHQHPRPRSSSAAETREYPKSCLQKFVFAAPQLPSTGPNLLGERLRFSSTSGGWWRVNRFRWRRWNARWRKIALHLIRLRALEQALSPSDLSLPFPLTLTSPFMQDEGVLWRARCRASPSANVDGRLSWKSDTKHWP